MQQHLDASVFRRLSVFIRGVIGRIVRKLVGRHCFGSVSVRQGRHGRNNNSFKEFFEARSHGVKIVVILQIYNKLFIAGRLRLVK